MNAMIRDQDSREGTKVLSTFVIILSVSILFLRVVATSRGQTTHASLGNVIMNGDSLSTFSLNGRQMDLAKSEIVSVQGQKFSQAMRVTTSPGASSEWNVQLSANSTETIHTGDVLLAQFWMRCTESMTGEGFAGFVYELAKPEFDKAAEVRHCRRGAMARVLCPFFASRDFPAGESRVCFRVGYDRQTIEIGGLQITNYGKGAKLEDLPRTGVSYAGRGPDAAWRKEALARIDKTRKADLTVVVTDASGTAINNATVQMTLRRHDFGFGSCVTVDNLLDPSPDGDRYREIVEKYFNFAVFENDMKWQALYGGIPPRSIRRWIGCSSETSQCADITWSGQAGNGCRDNFRNFKPDPTNCATSPASTSPMSSAISKASSSNGMSSMSRTPTTI